MAGAQCCENPPILNSACGVGSVDKIGGLDAYFTGSSDSQLAVLLISDVFGFEAPKLRILADKVANSGFLVVVPDFFHGDPHNRNNPENPLMVWLKSHGTDKGCKEAKPVIEALKNKGVSSIGVAGFCWGAKVVVNLAKSNDIDAAVLLHPSFVTVEDIKDVKCPISILAAEIDHMSPTELIKQFEEILYSKSEIDSFVKIFPGVSHGWTVRYQEEDEAVVKSANEAHGCLIDWLLKYVK